MKFALDRHLSEPVGLEFEEQFRDVENLDVFTSAQSYLY